MDLKVGETQDLTLWAFPKALEAVQDMLLGRIASNPTLVEFPISCVGAKPQVEVRLDMPLPVAPPAAPADAAAAAAAPAVVPEPVKAVEVAKPAAAAKGAAKKGKEPPAPELPLTPRSKVGSPCGTMSTSHAKDTPLSTHLHYEATGPPLIEGCQHLEAVIHCSAFARC